MKFNSFIRRVNDLLQNENNNYYKYQYQIMIKRRNLNEKTK